MIQRAGLLLLPLAAAFAGGSGANEPAPSFRHDVLPLLQRQGCASAYCHGSANGRGGFKLSLFGSDPRADWSAIARDLDGRRLDLVDPDASLVLAKPSLRLRHGGGRRLPRDGEAFATLRAWIASGARFDPAAGDLVALRLEQHDDRVRAIATMRTTAGDLDRDVTHLAMLSSSDADVASVEGDGRVQRLAPGRAWLFARYGNRDARLAVSQPFGDASNVGTIDGSDVDTAWTEELRELGLTPAAPAPADALARRLYLDLAGRAPTPVELDRFAAAGVPATAATLLREPAFARLWGEHLATWLELPADGDEPPQRQTQTARLRRDLFDALAGGATMNAIAARLLRDDDALLRRHADPRDRAELVGRAFLGVRIGCARCHDHPLDRWRRDEHLAFSAFFADPRPDTGEGPRAGQLFDPDTGAEVAPRLLPLTARPTPAGDRSAQLLQFVADPEHAAFARNIANRAFAALLGRGLVEPLDDHRLNNPPALPSVLEVLARRFVASDGDLRAVVLAVVTSRLYATDSTPGTDTNRDRAAQRFFARREARPLPPQRLRDTVAAILGHTPVEAPPVPRSPLARQLALLNGPLLDAALDAGGTTVDALVDFGGEPREQVTALFRLVLSRPPSSAERARFEDLFARDDRRAAVRDLARALFLCREFGSLR